MRLVHTTNLGVFSFTENSFKFSSFNETETEISFNFPIHEPIEKNKIQSRIFRVSNSLPEGTSLIYLKDLEIGVKVKVSKKRKKTNINILEIDNVVVA